MTIRILALPVAIVAMSHTRINAPDLRRARDELVAADSALASRVAKQQPGALVSALGAGAIVVASRRSPLRSRYEIETWVRNDSLAANGMSWHPVRADVSADGQSGYTYGFLTLTGTDGMERPGKYLCYWHRDSKRIWRVAAWKRLSRQVGVPGAIPSGFEMPTHRTARANPGGRIAALSQIAETDREFARMAQAGATAAFEKYVAPDGAILGSGPSIAYGPRLAAAEFSTFAPGTIDWEPQIMDAAGSGDLGFAIGPVTIRETPGAEGRIVGYYLTIWKRQADGTWRVIIDG
jgi:ketosteroid isomerase-like protein